jgi:hypothetical protein
MHANASASREAERIIATTFSVDGPRLT